ncbi:hypothetical protein CaCOL14_013155 [Colletotrichum acutatum]
MTIIIPMSRESVLSIARPRIPNGSEIVAFLWAWREDRECWEVVGRTLTRAERDSIVVQLDDGSPNDDSNAQVSRLGFQSSSISSPHENARSSPSSLASADACADTTQTSVELDMNDRSSQAPSIEVQDNETGQKASQGPSGVVAGRTYVGPCSRLLT